MIVVSSGTYGQLWCCSLKRVVERFTLNSVIQNFLPRLEVYIIRSCVFRCLAFLELSTGSVHCAPDYAPEQTELSFAFINLCCFLILFLVTSLTYVLKIINIHLT